MDEIGEICKWYFAKINMIDKPLIRMIRKSKKTQLPTVQQ